MSESLLSERQERVLKAVCDVLVPSLSVDPDPYGFWARPASALDIPTHIMTILAAKSPEEQVGFRRLLDLLSTPAAALSWRGPFKPFTEMTIEEQSELLRRWSRSPIAPLRMGFQALKRLTTFLFYGLSNEADNPNWPAIGYPGPLAPPPRIARPVVPVSLTKDTVLDCDTAVVGSGAGGGVVAGELARAGQDVVILEKGPYVAEDGFTQREAEVFGALYEASGTLATVDLGVAVLAGSCLGGGTTVNWSAAFRTPTYILEEWAREHHLPHLLSEEYQQSLEAVEVVTHVDTMESPCNPQNQALWDGCTARGAHVAKIPRNTWGCVYQVCGYCGLGCQRGAKKGTLKTYLQAAYDAGARILVNTAAHQVVVEQGRAVGVRAQQDDSDGQKHQVLVRAKRVVVAAGAIHTPALLRRSGLSHPHIGRHLYLHPTVPVAATYPKPINPWWGVMMAAVSDEWARLDGSYGFKLETPPAHPGLMALAHAWESGEQHKRFMLRAPRLATFIVLVRDREGGRVTVNRRGEPLLHYRLSRYDRQHLLRGITEASRVHAAAGAGTILLPHSIPREHSCSEGPEALERFLHGIKKWGWKANEFPLFSAHQMGTCRMGGDARRHPLTPEAETREVRHLFVADASAFPSASGVNPMLSIQALAHFAAQGIKAGS